MVLNPSSSTTLVIRKPNTTTLVPLRTQIWLDANNDGVLDAAERLNAWPLSGYGPYWSIPLLPPASARRNQPLRLRIVWGTPDFGDNAPCDRHPATGQVRDFTAVVSSVLAQQPPVATRTIRQLWPNPVSVHTPLHLALATAAPTATVLIRDVTGRAVLQRICSADAAGIVTLEHHGLSTGWYTVHIAGEAGALRLVVQ